MGVPQIWELLRPLLIDRRVPLKKFVIDFKTTHGRPPRIAIDGYSWIFECGFVLNQDTPKKYASHGTMAKAVLNFVHRLKEFLALDLTFMLVFDGNMKPSIKKNYGSNGDSIENDYLKTWNTHIRCHEQLGHCLKPASIAEDSDFMQVIKRILDSMQISYIEACGEGEAQCAWLQCQGYVDYVLSNDSDTLVFGCGRMLRNCSKFTTDLGVSGNSPQAKQASSRELFVTVIDLNELQACSTDRYNWWSLLFFSVILGADYNHGVKGMGKTKAAKLAQLRDPDFASQFHRLFGDLKNTCTDSDYEHFQEQVIQYCRANSVELFGRNYRTMLGEVSLEGWPSKTVVMYYFHPILIPAIDFSVFDKANVNISGNVNYQSLNFEKLKQFLVTFKLPAVTNFDEWYAETMQEPFVLRHILTNREQLTDYMQITDEKALALGGKFSLPCLKVRYRSYISFFITNQSPRKSQSPAKRKRSEHEYKYSLWIPQDLIPSNNVLLQRWKRTKNTKSPSPKKHRFSPQKNTLDDFLRRHTSPIKTPLSVGRSDVVLEPVKKRLFVDEAESNDSEDDSLIILGEVQSKDSQPS